MSMTHASAKELDALRNSDEFDADWYLQQYPDVRLLGMDPAEHYLWIGRALRRRGSPRSTLDKDSTAWDVLFVDGALGTTSTTYRVDHVARGLRAIGKRVHVVLGDELEPLLGQDVRARVVVFFRAPLWTPYREFADKMRRRGSIIVYDTDDFVFDEKVMPLMDGVRFLSENDVQNYRRGINAYRDFILFSDVTTVSTSALVDEVAKMGKPAHLVRNTISSRNLEQFTKIDSRSCNARPSPFVIGYYSGTKTHQADFAVMADALAEFMSEREDVVFRLVGQFALDEFPRYEQLASRVVRINLMPHDEMLQDQLNCDLIIAPLQIGNVFCEAKSELKFFEAALARRPVIASATRTFREATKDGRFARLAKSEAEWLAAFRDAYENYDRTSAMAEAAFDYVCTEYAEEAAAMDALAAYGEHDQPRVRHSSLSESATDVAVLITDVIIGGGGHRKVFNVCQALERHGYTVTIYILYSTRPEAVIRDEIRRYFYPLDAEVRHFRGEVQDHSYAICTHWTSAYEFRNVSFSGETLYFVQDFEPMFSAVGSDYMRSLATYSFGFRTICYGRWVAARLTQEIGIAPQVIPFALDHEVYRVGSTAGSRDVDILFFARPSQERRCFSLIMQGLKALKIARPSTRIALFGEDSYPDADFEHENFGLISDLGRLAETYGRTKVGICFSTTNPSQLGYEMIACGTVLVDVKTKFFELNFGGEEFVRYCIGTPESIAQACLELLGDSDGLARRRDLGLEFIKSMPDDDGIGEQFVRLAAMEIRDRHAA